MGLTRSTGNTGGLIKDVAALELIESKNNRELRLYDGTRYITSAVDAGGGVQLASLNFANPVSEGGGGSGVTSFNGRDGVVVPAAADYPPAFIGAVSIDGGVLTGDLTSSNGFSLNTTSLAVDNATSTNNINTLVKRDVNGSTAFTSVTVSTEPTQDDHLATKAYVDLSSGGGDISSLMPKSGGTFTGPVIFDLQASTDFTPTNFSHLTRKGYVDGVVDLKMPISGGTFTGTVSFSTNTVGASFVPTDNSHLTNKLYVDTGVNSALSLAGTANSTANTANSTANTANSTANAAMPRSGGTFTGSVSFNVNSGCASNPTNLDHYTRKGYVDTGVNAATSTANAAMPKTGGTFIGTVIFSGAVATDTAPSNGSHITNKLYVDTAIAAAIAAI